jgi:hypothetical protein
MIMAIPSPTLVGNRSGLGTAVALRLTTEGGLLRQILVSALAVG